MKNYFHFITKTDYITVYPNPNAGFTVDPQTTTYTDPVISFKDGSIFEVAVLSI